MPAAGRVNAYNKEWDKKISWKERVRSVLFLRAYNITSLYTEELIFYSDRSYLDLVDDQIELTKEK